MSTDDVIEQVLAIGQPKLEELGNALLARLIDQSGDYLDSAKARSPAIMSAMRDAKTFKLKALTSRDAGEAREWAAAVTTAIRRVKVLVKAEAVVVSDEAAEWFAYALAQALEVLADVGKTLLREVASGLISGALAGLTGGDGFDPSEMFQFG